MPYTLITTDKIVEIASNEMRFTPAPAHVDQLHELLKVEEYQDAFLDEDLREKLDAWHRKRKFRNRQIDFKSNLLEQTSAIAFVLILKHLTEERTFTKEEDPYVDQNPDQGLPLEELWHKPVFTDFAAKESKWVRTGSGTVVNCNKCRRRGVVDCRSCRGSGREERNCTHCSGRGDVTRIGHNGDHQRERCSRCRGNGKIETSCNRCHGRGEVKCPKCDGNKKLYVYELIHAKSRIEKEQKELPVFITLKPQWLNEVKPKQVLSHTEYNEQKIGDNVDTLSVGKQYEINIYEVKRIAFFHKEERELYLINEEIFSVETDYLYDKKSILLLIVGILLVLFLAFRLWMMWS